jgi:hypothetical protein
MLVRVNQQPCCQNFYEAACQVVPQFERSTSLSDTLPVSARRRSGRDIGERERVQRPDIVKRLSLARRGGSPFYARSVLKALFGAGARNDAMEERRCLCHGVHLQPVSDARSLLQLDDLSINS